MAENGFMRWATRFGKIGGVNYLDIQKLADETETNKKRDGTVRKLKVDLADGVEKSQGKLVVKSRKSYVAPKG